MSKDLISEYLKYTSGGEVPAFFSRWTLIAGVGALLGRHYNIQHGHFLIQPNLYCMLVGDAGSRKSTAIKLIKKLLVKSGYNTFAPNKTSKEKFLAKLAGMVAEDTPEELLERNLFNGHDVLAKGPIECFICSDEFNVFLGQGNMEFLAMLGDMWDYEGLWENELKNSSSDFIPDPTINILSGNTPTGFALAFPSEIFGQGFFSRMILVYGEKLDTKVTFPKTPGIDRTSELVGMFSEIRETIHGTVEIDENGEVGKILDRIYKSYGGMSDVRFDSYSNRRFTQLLKLCLIVSACRLKRTVSVEDVIYANTILTHTEQLMPKALGEFGKARNSDVLNKVLQFIYNSTEVVKFKNIWQQVHNDLDDLKDLAKILMNLQEAEKIQAVPGGGFLPKRKMLTKEDTGLVDYSLLTSEEREMKK